ncbi:MAG: ACT domain-containing protein [Sandaracinaceae bacterium]|nr:ACT domain-containing protein [Sandaracinaceae bacterium]
MAKHLRIHVSCPDDRGLLAAVAGRLYELGGDLGDASFAVLGEEASLTCVCALPDALEEAEVERALRALPALEAAEVAVRPFRLGHVHAQSGRATHVVRMRGLDRPGLLARLAEGFAELGANVVRFDAEHDERGEAGEYAMRFEVWIPAGREEAVLANASNAAESIGLRFAADRADD